MKIKLITAKDLAAFQERAKAREAIRRNLDRPTISSEEAEAIRARLQAWDTETSGLKKKAWLNTDRLVQQFDEVNGKATAHTYSLTDIWDRVALIERQLGKDGVAASIRSGISVVLVSGVPETNAYAKKARKAIATWVKLERGPSAWYVVGVEREERWAGSGGGEIERIHLTQRAQDAIVRKALKGYVPHSQSIVD